MKGFPIALIDSDFMTLRLHHSSPDLSVLFMGWSITWSLYKTSFLVLKTDPYIASSYVIYLESGNIARE